MKRDLEEHKPHGSKGFAFQAYGKEMVKRQNNFVASHWHKEIEIIRILYGKVELVVEGKYYEMKEGELWFCNAREIHQISSNLDTGGYRSIVFSPEVLGRDHEDLIGSTYLTSFEDKLNFPRRIGVEEETSQEYLQLFDAMYENYLYKPLAWQMEVRANLYLFYLKLLREDRFILREQNVSRERSQVSARLRTLLQYIEKDYANKITLEEAAQIMHLSPKYFCTFFQKNFHMSFVNFLNRYRIDQACLMLQTMDDTITEIAMKVGFDNISYFIRKFKEYEGCSPSEYRKRIRETSSENSIK